MGNDYRVIPIPAQGQKLLRDGFHGTSHDLVGKSIRPSIGTQHKVFNFSSNEHINYTAASPAYDAVQSARDSSDRYSTPNLNRPAAIQAEERGWSWAGSSAGRFPGRPRVYTGRAVGEIGGDGNLRINAREVVRIQTLDDDSEIAKAIDAGT